jgi:hypothetical protein
MEARKICWLAVLVLALGGWGSANVWADNEPTSKPETQANSPSTTETASKPASCAGPGGCPSPGCQSPKRAQHTYRFYYLKRLFAPEPIAEEYAGDHYLFIPPSVKVFAPHCPYAYPAEMAAWYDQR